MTNLSMTVLIKFLMKSCKLLSRHAD